VANSRQRILNVLARARFEDPESDGWMSIHDVRTRVGRNPLGLRMPWAIVGTTLESLEDQGLAESRWSDEAPANPREPIYYERRFGLVSFQVTKFSDDYARWRLYRITESGHHERARDPVRARGFLLGKLRAQPEAGLGLMGRDR
jgi:hypothetical protein